ncbi:MAG: MmcQ/YjbR family DNA-binding protein [Clostridia bacterium]
MVTKAEIIEFVQNIENVSMDSPFTDDFNTIVFRHAKTKKWFGLYMTVKKRRLGIDDEGEIDIINLKCEKELSYIIRNAYDYVIPAFHMNKIHWNTILLNSNIQFDELKKYIILSYDLTICKKT